MLLYLLFEHQSTDDPLMAFRLLRYMVRIWDEHLRDHPGATRLPAILPLVLHHSPDGWTSPTDFHALLDLDLDLDAAALLLVAAHVPSFRFLLDDVSAESDEDLRARAMTALGRLVLFCLRHAREPGRFAQEIARWLGLIAEARSAPGRRRGAAADLAPHCDREQSGGSAGAGQAALAVVGKQAERELMSIADWYEDRGRQAGLEKGRDEGARGPLLRQLRTRFGSMPDHVVARIQAADAAQLDSWADRVLAAATLDEVRAAS